MIGQKLTLKKIVLILPFCLIVSCKSDEQSLTVISTQSAPKAIGPYSQAVKTGKTVFCAGQIGISKDSGLLAGEDIATQTNQALQNIKAVLEASNSDFLHVVKVTVFLTNLDNYAIVNEIYAKCFGDHKPARSLVQVSRLPKDALIEIECIATTK